ncbi:DUF6894 family protein [Devosia submarina]|uniref:DUF6894 family protein n=1 Tax=Devosia submarina TaxID=1173082 RepID=UPI000D3BD23A|nr:hypothetical protein [Devosia submarina]
MPRFFFNHTTKTGEHEIDIDGLKLPSLNNAIEEASFAAHAAAALADEPTEGVFEIEDEGRVVVARVPYVASPEDEHLEVTEGESAKAEI